MMVITPKGDYVDESAYDLSTADKNCKDCYGTGIQGHNYDPKTGTRTRIICRCVPRKKLNGKAVF